MTACSRECGLGPRWVETGAFLVEVLEEFSGDLKTWVVTSPVSSRCLRAV